MTSFEDGVACRRLADLYCSAVDDGERVELRARRGVLASGGFANDPQLARDLLRLPGTHPWGPMPVFTCGGPRKDERARVVDPYGEPIPRLYAAGEVSSMYSWAMAGG